MSMMLRHGHLIIRTVHVFVIMTIIIIVIIIIIIIIILRGGRSGELRQAHSFRASSAVVGGGPRMRAARETLQQVHEAAAKFRGGDEINKEVDGVVGIGQEIDHLLEEVALSTLFEHSGVV